MKEKTTVYLLMISLVILMAGCIGPKPAIVPQSAVDTPQSAYDQGMKSLNDSRYDEAINFFQHAVGLDPVFEPAYIGLGLAYTGKEDYDNAKRNIKEALSLKKDPAAYVAYGRFYVAQSKFEKAQSKYNKAIDINPKDAEAFYYKGQMYEKMGKYDQARIVYNNALVVNPKYDKATEALKNLSKTEGPK